MKLRTKILLVTFLTILFVQGLNCFLEIGFLLTNLEENSLKKYQAVGKEIKRKLNKSLIFGKPLAHINYKRLLSKTIPDDVDGFYIVNPDGKAVYSKNKDKRTRTFVFKKAFSQVKTMEEYQIYIPLSAKSKIKGNIVIVIPLEQIKEQLFFLIENSVKNFLLVVAVTLPVLYLILTLVINRPYMKFVHDLEIAMETEDYQRLKGMGIDLSRVSDVQDQLGTVKSGKWLGIENSRLYADLDFKEQDREKAVCDRMLHERLMKLLNTG